MNFKKIWFFLIFFFSLSSQALGQEAKLPFSLPKNPSVLPRTALIETTQGAFEIEFYRTEAPITVRNFLYLGRKNFYKGLTFHRYIENFVIQGGDPRGDGQGGPPYFLPPEFSDIVHEKGTIGMARVPSQANPERFSNGSQFYITLTKAPHLDGLYSVFGRVIKGFETVEKLREGDKILRIRFPKGYKYTAHE